MVRRARLKPEYAARYPRIQAGEWHHAWWLSEVVRRQLRGDSALPIGGRVLNEQHFDFEAGERFPYLGRERRTPLPELR
jgi:hypothetical protein